MTRAFSTIRLADSGLEELSARATVRYVDVLDTRVG
jgi:hypothetical protein